jgi:hypothetical protein
MKVTVTRGPNRHYGRRARSGGGRPDPAAAFGVGPRHGNGGLYQPPASWLISRTAPTSVARHGCQRPLLHSVEGPLRVAARRTLGARDPDATPAAPGRQLLSGRCDDQSGRLYCNVECAVNVVTVRGGDSRGTHSVVVIAPR